MSKERQLNAIVSILVDPRGVRDVEQASEKIDEALMDLQNRFYKLTDPVNDIGMLTGQLEGLGFEVQDYGRRIQDTWRDMSQMYVDAAEMGEKASRDYLEAQGEIEAQQRRLGKQFSQQMLPYMKLQAKLLEMATDFIERYPAIADIAFGIGSGLVLATSLANATAKGIRLFADAKLIIIEAQRVIAAKMIRDAAKGQVAAGVMMMKAADMQALSTGGAGLKGILGMGGSALAGSVSVGGLASAAAVLAPIAALTATGILIKKWSDDGKKSIKEMGNRWDTFFDKQEKTTSSAVQTLDEYRKAQERVGKAHDDAGVIADVFLDKQKLMNASNNRLNQALLDSANSYEDYEEAVKRFNDELAVGKDKLLLISRAAYEYRQELNATILAYQQGAIGLSDVGRKMQEGNMLRKALGTVVEGIAESMEADVLRQLVPDWEEYQDALRTALKTWMQENTDAQAEYDAERAALEEETGEERTRIIGETNDAILALELASESERTRILESLRIDIRGIEESIAAERTEAMTSFHEDMTAAEEDYYRSRAERAQDFGLETARMEADHQRDMRRNRQDANRDALTAIRNRDALQLRSIREQQEIDRQRAEEDYLTEMGRRNQDFAREMAQSEAEFQRAQAERQKQYDEQLADLARRLEEERRARQDAAKEEEQANEDARVNELNQLVTGKEEQLLALEEADNEQERELNRSLQDRLTTARGAYFTEIQDARRNWDQRRTDAGVYMRGEKTIRDAHYAQMLSALTRWVSQSNAVISGLKIPASSGWDGGMAGGGYATYGHYTLGESGDEYVMKASTTRMAEQLAGGRLSDNALLALMAGNMPRITLQQTFSFQGSLSEAEKAEYKRIAHEQSLRAISRVVKEAKKKTK